MADIWFLVGALIPTFLASRIALWLLKRWNGGYARVIVAHGCSLGLISILAGFGMADGGPFDFGRGFANYVLPQAIWLVVDAWRHRKGLSEAPARP